MLTKRRGIGNYVYNLLSNLVKLSGDEEYILYVDSEDALKDVPVNPRLVTRVLKPKFEPLWEQICLPLAVAHDRPDVLHCIANTAPIFLPVKVKLVMTIHDVMYMLPRNIYPESPSQRQRWGRRYSSIIVPRAARRAAHIITVSGFSRRDIIERLGIENTRISVVSEAPGNIFRGYGESFNYERLRLLYSLGTEYIIALGAVDPRKNIARLIQAFAMFRRRKSLGHQLVICGLNSNARQWCLRLAKEAGVVDQVRLLGFVTEVELAMLYKHAKFMVYPSLYEGFGLPVLESMASGTAVITSETTSLPEVAGDAAYLIDPTSIDDLEAAMLRLVDDEALRQKLVTRGLKRAAEFSWSKCAQETLNVYREVGRA